MKLSSPHFVRYDAQTYAERGFLEVSGRVRDMAQKPRHWQITATARTQNPETGEMVKHHFKFRTHQKCRLSELSELVNDEIHKTDDFLPDCMSVMVVARILL